MRALFVDTAGWMACVDVSDPACATARAARDTALRTGSLLVTTDYVVDETLTLLRSRLGIDVAEAWWILVERSSRIRWESINGVRAEKARHEFFRHRDKLWSFTDCTSLVVMHEMKIRDVLTTDRDFVQMGFRILPGSSGGDDDKR